MFSLEIDHLTVALGEKILLRDFSFCLPRGEVHALMGPNGTGKSTLAKVLARHPDYTVVAGDVRMDGFSILDKTPDEVSRMGLFLAFQYPMEIPGVTVANFIRSALKARLPQGEKIQAKAYYQQLYERMDQLKMDRSFTARFLNEGFSGGEKKRCEVLQMLMLQPSYCILDETDSGLDIDALRIVGEGITQLAGSERGILVITHYPRLLSYIIPHRVHIMQGGRIVRTGDQSLAFELEASGYEALAAPPGQEKA